VAKKSKTKDISLRSYMAAYPQGLGVMNAVHLLLPVALQLQDLHSSGCVHLQVSADSVFVGADGAKLADPTASEADRYISGYAPGEIYSGKSAGNRSDIYSFCAVLSFAASGVQPRNTLSQEEQYRVPTFAGPFAEVVETGMAAEAETRFASMQEVIAKLSVYIDQPIVSPQSSAGSAPKAKKKKSKAGWIIALLVLVILLVVGAAGTYAFSYLKAIDCVIRGDFDAAAEQLWLPQITQLHDTQLLPYVEAGQKLSEEEYEEAKELFQGLSGYLEADALAQEADYRRAAQYADADRFDEAQALYEQLGEYKDSAEKIQLVQLQRGTYLLYEEQDYQGAYDIFHSLSKAGYNKAEDMEMECKYVWSLALIDEKEYIRAYQKLNTIRDYGDTNSTMASLEEVLYQEGLGLYHAGQYTDAQTYFEYAASCPDSEKYLMLIEARLSASWYDTTVIVEKLMDIFEFEDTAQLLVSKDILAKAFLMGMWEGDGYYFEMQSDGSISYSLPWIDYGDYYKVVDGKVLLYPQNNATDTRDLFFIEVLTPDCIAVLCYKDNTTYTLYRQ